MITMNSLTEITKVANQMANATKPVTIVRARANAELDTNKLYTAVFVSRITVMQDLYVCPNVFLTWNTDNVLDDYEYKYEILETRGHCEDPDMRFSFLEEFKDDSMERFGNPIQKDDKSTTWVVGFFGSHYRIPTGDIMVGIFPSMKVGGINA